MRIDRARGQVDQRWQSRRRTRWRRHSHSSSFTLIIAHSFSFSFKLSLHPRWPISAATLARAALFAFGGAPQAALPSASALLSSEQMRSHSSCRRTLLSSALGGGDDGGRSLAAVANNSLTEVVRDDSASLAELARGCADGEQAMAPTRPPDAAVAAA